MSAWLGPVVALVIFLLTPGSPIFADWRRSQSLHRDAGILAALPEGDVRDRFEAHFTERCDELVRARRDRPSLILGWAMVLVVLFSLVGSVGLAMMLGPEAGGFPLRFLVSAGATFGTLSVGLAVLRAWARRKSPNP